MRIGIGYDTHRVAPCRRLVLGGVDIPHDKGLLGHSDADALLHAIMDALLGAAGKSDIGEYFPDTDESLKDISSMTLLARVAAMLRAERFTVVNIDAVIIAQKPKLAPYIQQMRENIADLLGIPVKMVNVKATTEEGLGFVGAEEGISAQAVCILKFGGWKTMGIFESVRSIKARDPAIRSGIEIILYPTFWSMGFHRVAHALYNCKLFFVSRLISQLSRLLTGIEIHPGAKIGKRFFIDHGMGVVIGETCEIGDDVIVYQGVTLGGTGKDTGKRHPTLGNNVLVGSGAKVLGGFTVGNNVRIGAGSVVLSAVPDDCTVVGIPARVIARKEDGLKSERLEQRFPDPVAMELCQMKSRIEQLEAELRALKGEGEEETAAPGGVDEPAKENHDENIQHVE